MFIKSLSWASAITLAAIAGSASAAEGFTVLDGIEAETLSAAEMDSVQGKIDVIVLELTRPAGPFPFFGMELAVPLEQEQLFIDLGTTPGGVVTFGVIIID